MSSEIWVSYCPFSNKIPRHIYQQVSTSHKFLKAPTIEALANQVISKSHFLLYMHVYLWTAVELTHLCECTMLEYNVCVITLKDTIIHYFVYNIFAILSKCVYRPPRKWPLFSVAMPCLLFKILNNKTFFDSSLLDYELHSAVLLLFTCYAVTEPGVPYKVTVRARTAAGLGEPVSIVVFAVQQGNAKIWQKTMCKSCCIVTIQRVYYTM